MVRSLLRRAGALVLGTALTACQASPPAPLTPAAVPAAPVAPAPSAGGEGTPAPSTGAPTSAAPAAAQPGGPAAASPGASAAPGAPSAPAPGLPPPVAVAEAVAVIVGAAEPLSLSGPVTVDPGATFRVVLRGRYADARLSLLDAADAMVPGAGGREAAADTTVTFEPAAPLRPAASYRLRVDGAATRELHAADGTPRSPVEIQLVAAGEAPEPKAKPRPRKKKP